MFKGVFTALLTPFKNGVIDESSFRSFIDFQIDSGIHGLGPVGTTGESPTVSNEEHKLAVEICINQVNNCCCFSSSRRTKEYQVWKILFMCYNIAKYLFF